MTTATEAREALAAMQASREQLARVAHCPAARHLAFAALEGALVLSPALGEYQIAMLVPVFVALPLIIRWDRRRLGMFINGYRRGKTRTVVAVLLPLLMGLFLLSTWCVLHYELRWPSVVLAVIALGVAYYGSVIWQRVFARELGLAA